MFCTQCGKALIEQSKFCPHCGAPRVVAAGATKPDPVTPAAVLPVQALPVPPALGAASPTETSRQNTLLLLGIVALVCLGAWLAASSESTMDTAIYAGILFILILGMLGLVVLQAIGFAMFSGLKAPQRPSYKALLGVWIIAPIGAFVFSYLFSWLVVAIFSTVTNVSTAIPIGNLWDLTTGVATLMAFYQNLFGLMFGAVAVVVLVDLLAPLVATVAVTKVSWRQAALSLTLIYALICIPPVLMAVVVLNGSGEPTNPSGRSANGAQAPTVSTVGEDTATTAEITAASGDGGVSVAVALNPVGDVDFYELTLTARVGAEDEDSEGDTWLSRIALNTTSEVSGDGQAGTCTFYHHRNGDWISEFDEGEYGDGESGPRTFWKPKSGESNQEKKCSH